MKRVLTSLAICLCCVLAKAQMVEQVIMSAGTNTYLTGINNNNFVTGYYTAGTASTGFIITPNGKRLLIEATDLSVNSVTVESINEQNTALVVGNTGGTKTLYRAYVNENEIVNIVQCTNVMQPNTVPTDISDNNDIVGGYSGGSDFVFIKHDSIVPTGNQAWIAKRYDVGGLFNTFGAGINNANKVTGHYIDGSVLNSFVYDNISHTFNVLNSAFKVKPWDINNDDYIAGEYRQTNGVYMAFFGKAINGGYTQFTSLNTIFSSNTIQSVANGINDNKDIVGSFLDPNTNTWKGFIYHPDIAEYRLPGFDFTQNTWTIHNVGSAPNTAWPQSYWQGIDYETNDPYANNNVPVVDTFITKTFKKKLKQQADPTWRSFATEFDKEQVGISINPDQQQYYLHVLKPKIFDRYKEIMLPSYGGHCYGIALSALIRTYNDNNFSSWFNMPTGANINSIQNTDNIALFAIERCLNKQMDKDAFERFKTKQSTWSGLYRFKNESRKTVQTTSPMVFGFEPYGTSTGWHAVMPYKVRTPRILPFSGSTRDTLFISDSNHPNDSTVYITIDTRVYEPAVVTITSNFYSNAANSTFNFPGVRDLDDQPYSNLKSTAAPEYDTTYIAGVGMSSDHVIKRNNVLMASEISGTYYCDSVDMTPVRRFDAGFLPSAYLMDTSDMIDIVTSNYEDSVMAWTQINNSRSMGITRNTLPGETDHSTQKSAMITYGNPDNTTKYLAGFMRESEEDLQQGVNIIVNNICAAQGDSIVTHSPSSYVYTVTKVNGTSNCTYELDVFAAYNGVMTEFHSTPTIEANSSHTIDPYYVGNNGTQVVVIIDNGLDGNPDDTLYITGFPVDLRSPIKDDKIKVYPNPVTEQLSIELASIHDNYEIRLTDAVGKVVYTSTGTNGKMNIPMTQYPSGMYILQITDAKGHTLYLDKITKQ